MIQHRHFFPGYVGPASSNDRWWHDEQMVHKKYPTAHAGGILETRVKGDSSGKQPTPIRPKDPVATRALYELERID